MDDLQAAVEALRTRIGKLQTRHHQPNEQETKQALITPMLRALGWDCEEVDAVRLEYRYRPQDNPVDYALMIHDTPRLFVEAKSLGQDVGEYKWRTQTVNYANAAGVRWCVLTDGNFWMVYRSNAEGDIDQKLFLETWLHRPDGKRPPHEPADVLSLLSADSIAGDRLGSRWERLDVDRRGGQALRDLVEKRDGALVRLVQKHTGLTKGEVLNLLSRVRVTLEPGAVDAKLLERPKPPRETPPKMPRGEGRLLRLSGRMGAEKKGVTAECRMVGDGKTARYVVLKGSLAVAEVTPHFLKSPSLVTARQDLIDRGVLERVSDAHYRFTRDEEFTSSSVPAGIILGSSSQGPLCWKDDGGCLLKDLLAELGLGTQRGRSRKPLPAQ